MYWAKMSDLRVISKKLIFCNITVYKRKHKREHWTTAFHLLTLSLLGAQITCNSAKQLYKIQYQ